MDFAWTSPNYTPFAQTFLSTPYRTPFFLFYGHYMCHKMAGLPIRLVAQTIPLNGITTSPSCRRDSHHFIQIRASSPLLLGCEPTTASCLRFPDWRGKRHWFFLLPFKKPTRLSRRPRPPRPATRCVYEADRPLMQILMTSMSLSHMEIQMVIKELMDMLIGLNVHLLNWANFC